MIGCVGDAFLDVSVRLEEPLKPQTDTTANIQTRQGGSAANVAVEAARLCGSAKFIGVIGADLFGQQISAELSQKGVEVCGPSTGRTGCIVALLNERGEASMLSDRAGAAQMSSWEPNWLEGLKALHVTSYAFFAEPLATAARELLVAAAQAGVLTSVDVSSVGGVQQFGVARYADMLRELPVDVLLPNAAEAALLASEVELSSLVDVVVTKQGAGPTLLHQGTRLEQFPPSQLTEVVDTVGAGDAFAAGLLVARAVEGRSWPEAVLAGQEASASLLHQRTQSRTAKR